MAIGVEEHGNNNRMGTTYMRLLSHSFPLMPNGEPLTVTNEELKFNPIGRRFIVEDPLIFWS